MKIEIMREIKFRGKTIKKEWVYGDLMQKPKGQKFIHVSPIWHEVIPETIGQYTGLKDEYGVEIYEGDILMEQCRTLTCKFANGGFIFCLPSGNRLTEIDTEFMRVIGNIHDK